MQVQLSILYLASVWTKLASDTWNNGTAVSFAVRLEDLERFDARSGWPTPSSRSTCSVRHAGARGGARVLVWNRTLRPYVLGLGVAMHLSIDLSLRVGYLQLRALCPLYRVPVARLGQRDRDTG